MLKKIFLLFSLLVFSYGEVLGQVEVPDYGQCTIGTPKSALPWFDKYCGGDKYKTDVGCVHRLTGIHKILEWNSDHFKKSGQTTATHIYSLESRFTGHAFAQKQIIQTLVPGKIVQYTDICDTNRYETLPKGSIATIAVDTNFQDCVSKKSYNFSHVQAVVVTASGNDDTTRRFLTFKGANSENVKLPFLIGVSGYNYSDWADYCNRFSDRFDICSLYRINSYCPGTRNFGANVCGEQSKNICLLGPYVFPFSYGLSTIGTSGAASYTGGVLWSVAYFLKNKYEWSKPMTQLQATITAVAIVKSCTMDIKKHAIEGATTDATGPDYETGLGYLSVECLNDDSDDGFIDNPLSVIKDELYLVPSDSYIKPQMATSSTTQKVDIRIFLEGLLP